MERCAGRVEAAEGIRSRRCSASGAFVDQGRNVLLPAVALKDLAKDPDVSYIPPDRPGVAKLDYTAAAVEARDQFGERARFGARRRAVWSKQASQSSAIHKSSLHTFPARRTRNVPRPVNSCHSRHSGSLFKMEGAGMGQTSSGPAPVSQSKEKPCSVLKRGPSKKARCDRPQSNSQYRQVRGSKAMIFSVGVSHAQI